MAKVATKAIDGMTLTVTFTNGQSLICDGKALDESIWARLAMHGLSQKVGDSYASAESVDEAFAAAQATWDGLLSGDWATRSGGGILAEALAKVTGKDLVECIAAIRKLDDKSKRKLAKDARILSAIAEIQKARAGESAGDLANLF